MLWLTTLAVVAAAAGLWLVFMHGGSHAATVAGQRAATTPGAPVAAGHAIPTGLHPAARARPAGATLEVPDSEAAQSFADPVAAAAHAAARTPATAVSNIAPGAPTDAQVTRELAQLEALQHAHSGRGHAGSIDAAGQAIAPAGAPQAVAAVIAGGNAIADFPYVYGGGHASFVDTAYDCSGSVSYALAAGGMIASPVTSGELMSWGAPGPGRWISVYAHSGHTFMVVAGLRFDTSGRAGPLSTRWSTNPRSTAGFAVRHWPGL
ncbi:MAG: hypothetical protein DLM63_05400 [Solirubrobacterales bacterium]|nr:MAG: hypothetical protein DLM63_05400 [Solirubrobacterales bacterium]